MTAEITPQMIAIADQRIAHTKLMIDKLVEAHHEYEQAGDPTVATMQLAGFLDDLYEGRSYSMAVTLAAAIARLAAQ